MRLNLKNSLYFLLFFASCTITSPRATQLITLLLDDSEPADDADYNTRLGAIANDLYILLLQKTSVIIVNDHVLNYLMTFLKNNNNPYQLSSNHTIDPKDFIKQKITDHLYVIIPKKYIETLPNYNSIKKELQNKKTNFSAEELTIGIQLKGKNINDNDFLNPSLYGNAKAYDKRWIDQTPITWQKGSSKSTSVRKISASWVSEHLIKNLSNIFITQQMYDNIGVTSKPISVIIAFGHGSPSTPISQEIVELQKQYGDNAANEIQRLKKLQEQGFTALLGGQIAGFASPDFGDFVAYTSKHLGIFLLFFNTCYGSDVNIQAALYALAQKKKTELKNIKIPYIIISGASSNAPAIASIQTKGTIDNKNNTILRPLYTKFMEELNKGKELSDAFFVQTLNTIYSFYYDNNSYSNIPIIKYPEETNWRPIHIPNKMLVITPELVQKYKSNNTNIILISDFFKLNKGDTPVVLLATYTIPFTLSISGNSILPAFISFLPGHAMHYIAKIDAPNYKLSDVIKSFFKIQHLEDIKMFLIDKLVATNDFSFLGGSHQITLDKVIIHVGSYNKIQFIYNNENWATVTENLPKNKPFNFTNLLKNIEQVSDDKITNWSVYYNKFFPPKESKQQQITTSPLQKKQADEALHTFANALFDIA